MTCNLFSSFDPSVIIATKFFQLGWIATFMVFVLFYSYFLIPSWSMLYLIKIFNIIISMTVSIFSKTYKNLSMLMVAMFTILMSINELGMLPFMFVPTGHMAFNMSLSIPFWLSGIMYSWYNSPNHFLSHLLPVGSPKPLIPFLILIESISLIIRPFSLSVRLMSNILAGHMILTLMVSSMFPLVIPISSLFILFEVAVSMVQAFVFSNLMMMYLRESY